MADSGSDTLNPDPTRLLFARILRGVVHDLNGIAANLLGLVQATAEPGAFADMDPLSLFQEEASRVGIITSDLAALPLAITMDPNTVALPELLKQAIRLLDHDPDYGDVRKTTECMADLPELYARRQTLLEAFLLAGALACDAAGHRGEVIFLCERQRETVGIRIFHKSGSSLDWNDRIRKRVTTLVESENGKARLGERSTDFSFPIPR